MNLVRHLFVGILIILAECSSAAPQAKKVVAIEDFDVVEGTGATGENVAILRAYITDGIINCRKFSLVEREDLKKLAKEQALTDSGLTENGPESNSLKAAMYLVYGKILKATAKDMSREGYNVWKGSVELQIRFTNAESGKVLGVKTVDVSEVKGVVGSIDDHLAKDVIAATYKKAAYEVVNLLVQLAYPAKVLDVDADEGIVMVNMTMEQCKEGEEFEVFKLGRELVDPDTGEFLGRSEKNVGRVVVFRAGPKISEFKPMAGTDIGKFETGMILRRARNRDTRNSKPALGLR